MKKILSLLIFLTLGGIAQSQVICTAFGKDTSERAKLYALFVGTEYAISGVKQEFRNSCNESRLFVGISFPEAQALRLRIGIMQRTFPHGEDPEIVGSPLIFRDRDRSHSRAAFYGQLDIDLPGIVYMLAKKPVASNGKGLLGEKKRIGIGVQAGFSLQYVKTLGPDNKVRDVIIDTLEYLPSGEKKQTLFRTTMVYYPKMKYLRPVGYIGLTMLLRSKVPMSFYFKAEFGGRRNLIPGRFPTKKQERLSLDGETVISEHGNYQLDRKFHAAGIIGVTFGIPTPKKVVPHTQLFCPRF